MRHESYDIAVNWNLQLQDILFCCLKRIEDNGIEEGQNEIQWMQDRSINNAPFVINKLSINYILFRQQRRRKYYLYRIIIGASQKYMFPTEITEALRSILQFHFCKCSITFNIFLLINRYILGCHCDLVKVMLNNSNSLINE